MEIASTFKGAVEGRPQLLAAIELAAQPGGCLVVACISRISRDPAQLKDVVQQVTAGGGKVLVGVP